MDNNYGKPHDIECELAVDISHWTHDRLGSSEPYFDPECAEASRKVDELLKLLN